MADILDLRSLCGWSGRKVPCDLPVPKREINSLFLKEVIDKGAYGVIYSAFDNDTHTDLIIKIFKGTREEIDNEICYQHLASKIRVAPDILDYWFCGSDYDRALIAMDYGGNYNLESYLNVISTVKIIDVDTLKLALQVYPAMLNLYRRTLMLNNIAKIFHLDLHLRNAMVTTNKDLSITGLKIIDFGKAVNWQEYQKIINEEICSKEPPESFNGVGVMYKNLYVDIMMPTEFYHDKFILEPSANLAMNWLFGDFISQLRYERFIIKNTNWSFESRIDITDHIGHIRETMMMDIEFHIEKEYPKLYKEIEKNQDMRDFLSSFIKVLKG